ncbi:cyclic-di-AMP receptor [Peptoniphilus grossensis]|uniref:cyclic-di-AMP receptor n=1 Tax=Peptoniphilus grossensis TaxID=1465756 RepID=UPI0029069A94|nr:cyclic-di-AMP receptor [Peptoniphilus grossensis]MDU7151720.1 cyclic-di-AMP receptor [Peptoniphilus grossensis]
MKLIIAIVQDEDSDNLVKILNKNDFKVTKISSTGGFLKSGNVTLLSGIEDEEKDRFMGILEENSRTREVKRTIQPINIPGQAMIPVPITVKVGGATIFVIDVFDFKKF